MIELNLEFHASDILSVVGKLLTLPEKLRPTHHSFGEDEPDELILSPQAYLTSLEKAGLGPFLKGQAVTYDVGFFDGLIENKRVTSSSISCNCSLNSDPSLAKDFLVHMASLNPLFGFASSPEEREHRNRVVVQQGENTIESWVGRDPQKFVPGFYWLTLLSHTLIEKHSVPVVEVRKIAKEYTELEGGQYLFRFYQNPEDWRMTTAVAQLCASIPGVFDVEKIKLQLSEARNYIELDSILQKWG